MRWLAPEMALLEELENAMPGNEAGATGDEYMLLGHGRVPEHQCPQWGSAEEGLAGIEGCRCVGGRAGIAFKFPASSCCKRVAISSDGYGMSCSSHHNMAPNEALEL